MFLCPCLLRRGIRLEGWSCKCLLKPGCRIKTVLLSSWQHHYQIPLKMNFLPCRVWVSLPMRRCMRFGRWKWSGHSFQKVVVVRHCRLPDPSQPLHGSSGWRTSLVQFIRIHSSECFSDPQMVDPSRSSSPPTLPTFKS